MPSIKVVPPSDSSRVGYNQVQAAMGAGATGPLQLVTPAADAATGHRDRDGRPGHCTGDACPARGRRPGPRHGHPAPGPLQPRGRHDDRPAPQRGARRHGLGGAVAENHDLQNLLSSKTALVIGVVLVLGFLLLLFALQAPLLAAAGVLTNLLATAAAFGVSKLDLPGRRPSLAARLPATGVP